MYVVTVQFEIHPEHVEEFRATVMQQSKDSLRSEPCCRQFDVCIDPDRPGSFFLYEKYDDSQAFQMHLDSAHFRRFDARVTPWVVSKDVRSWAEAGLNDH